MGKIGELIADSVGDTLRESSGCAILAVLVLPIGCVSMVISDHNEKKEKAKTEQVEREQSCAAERAMTDDESMNQCQNAAALFGQDISDNPARLSACVESRERKLAQCAAHGL